MPSTMPDPTCTSKQCECDPNPRLDRGVATPGVVRAAMEARRQQWQANRPWCAGQARLACRLRLGCAPHSPSTLPRGRGWALAAVGRRRLGQRRTCLPGPRAGDQPVLAALTSSSRTNALSRPRTVLIWQLVSGQEKKGDTTYSPRTRLSKGSIDGLRTASGCALPRRATISPLEGLRTARPRSTTTTDRPTDRPRRARTDGGR